MTTPSLILDAASQTVSVDDPSPSVSVRWDRAAQAAVTADVSGPTIASRAYALTHTAIYDAWAAGEETASGIHFSAKSDLADPEIEAAMSHAAHAMLVSLFPDQEATFDARLREMGLVPGGDGEAAELGRAAANAVIKARLADGANQAQDYQSVVDPCHDPIYTAVNASPLEMRDIQRWTPESIPLDPEDASPEQWFLTPHWGRVDTFGLESGDAIRPVAPEPFFLVDGATMDFEAKTIALANGDVVPVSRDLIGTIINPGFIAQAERVVEASANLTDKEKMIAEFWEDGRNTSFPPGTMMTLAQFVSAREDHTTGEDARMFLAMGNAQMDAGIAAWDAKVHYDYTRPVRAIRELGALGLIGEPGTDEMTGETGFVVKSWGGPGEGKRLILAENWLSYQPPGGEPSPAFAEYVSGHSTFSAAGAEVLRLFAGSDTLGASVSFQPGDSRFEGEDGPTNPVTLAWETLTQAADESGISRIYGGIHFDDGNHNGLAMGREAARASFERAMEAILGVGAGDDTVVGTDDDDVLAGLGGNDTITTGGGRDTIVHGGDHGTTRVTDFDVDGRWNRSRGVERRTGEDSADVLVLTGVGPKGVGTQGAGPGVGALDGEYRTAGELRGLVEALINDGDDTTNVIVLRGDVTFVFGEDGTVVLEGVAREIGGRKGLVALGAIDGRLMATDGDDRLRGGRDDALYAGGRGDDVIRTGDGLDTVAFSIGDGRDTVTDFDVDGGNETDFDALMLSGFGALDGRYSTAAELMGLADALNADDDEGTRAEVRRGHLVLTFGDGDVLTLRRVAKDLA